MAGTTQHTIDVQLRLLESAVSSGFGQLSGQLRSMQSQADQFSKTMRAAFGFHELERFGKAGMNAFGGMISQAATLQESMTKVRVATGANAAEMASLGKLILDTSSKHAMSTKQAADMIAVAARTGMSQDTIKKTFGDVAMFSDIEKFERGMDFESSSKLAASVSRFFGARTPEQSEKVLNNLYRAMNATPIAPGQLFTSLQNFAPIGERLGMSQEETFQAAALMGTMGLGSKGGTGLFNVLLRSIGKTPSLTSHRESNQMKAFKDLGLIDSKGNNLAFEGGKFQFAKLFGMLTDKAQTMDPKRFIADIIGAFNDRGGRVAAALSTPDAQKNLVEMMGNWKNITGLQEAYALEQKNLTYQANVLSTNFDNLKATMGDLSVKALAPASKALADWTAKFDSFLKLDLYGAKQMVGAGVLGGEALSAGATLGGKIGSAYFGYQALKSIFTGRGAPVYVTNMKDGSSSLPGQLAKGGSFLGSLATGAKGAAAALGSEAAMVAGAAGLGAFAIYEGVSALASSGKTSAARRQSIYDAVSSSPVSQSEQQRRVDAAEAALHPGRSSGGDVHIHGDVHVKTDNAKGLADELRLAANRSSGSSSTSPVHSPSSGYGGAGGP